MVISFIATLVLTLFASFKVLPFVSATSYFAIPKIDDILTRLHPPIEIINILFMDI